MLTLCLALLLLASPLLLRLVHALLFAAIKD